LILNLKFGVFGFGEGQSDIRGTCLEAAFDYL
jgi:hypothetical protein